MELTGKYSDCKIFAENVDKTAIDQVQLLLDHPAFKECKIRFMPDIHAGAGTVIGTTAEYKDKIIPNMVGVDLSCGVTAWNLGNIEIDFQKLDDFIRQEIPFGMRNNTKYDEDLVKYVYNGMFPEREPRFPLDPSYSTYDKFVESVKSVCQSIANKTNSLLAIGSLGGGN